MQKELSAFVKKTKPQASPEAVIQGADYRFTVLTERLIRLEYQKDGEFMDAATQCVVCRSFPCPEFRVQETEQRLEIVTSALHLYYDKKPFSPQGLRIQLHRGYAVFGSVWNYGDVLQDLKGTTRTLDNADGPVELDSGLMSRDGFSVLDDSNSLWFDDSGWMQQRTAEEIDLYFFGYGHDYLGCLRDFYTLCGPAPLVPRFALGNWWSRFCVYTEQSYLTLMDRFEGEGIPIATAVLDMDWHLTHIPERYGSGWTGYTWNRDYFPDPKRFLDRLHERGLHVTLNVHPADGVRAFEDAYPAMAKALGVDDQREDKIPFDLADPDFAQAYFKYLHHPLEEQGVDFWWLDWQQGSLSAVPGLDPLWLLNHQHFADSGREGKQPLTFSRYAGIGSHRYPIGFSGDTVTSWKSLEFQPYFTANASNVGYTWWSHDIGGHQRGTGDDELAVRWVQFGVFSPIMRLHSTSSPFCGKEPWNYGLEAQKSIQDFMRLRHRLIPYLYTMDYLTAREGLPLMQPMYYRHDVGEAYTIPNEYYFGSQMIACPITQPTDRRTGLAEFHAWLPQGVYYDFFTKDLYRGDKRITLYRPICQMPVLLPAGSILPLAGDYMESHISNPTLLDLEVYHGADGSFTLWEDDGGWKCPERIAKTHFTYRLCPQEGSAVFSARLEGDYCDVIPDQRVYTVTVFGVSPPEEVSISAPEQVKLSWSYDANSRSLRSEIRGERLSGFELTFRIGGLAPVGQDMEKRLFELLLHAQIEHSVKDQVYRIATQKRDLSARLAELMEKKVEPNLLGAVAELLTMDQ